MMVLLGSPCRCCLQLDFHCEGVKGIPEVPSVTGTWEVRPPHLATVATSARLKRSCQCCLLAWFLLHPFFLKGPLCLSLVVALAA